MVTKMSNYSFQGIIFDLDGVVTKTAQVHAAAWKEMFDEYLRLREKRDGEVFKEFTYEEDYLTYVDGKPRYNGVQSFLESRAVQILFGDPGDHSDKETVCGLGNRKNDKFLEVLNKEGVQAYDSTIAIIKQLKLENLRIGVASSSKNCLPILKKTGLESYFETRVDGVVSAELKLQGKPKGDIFVKAAENLNIDPKSSIVVEDAVSGVQAGKNGGFGLVIGLARENNQKDLLENGADVVVDDFEGVNLDKIEQWFIQKNNQ